MTISLARIPSEERFDQHVFVFLAITSEDRGEEVKKSGLYSNTIIILEHLPASVQLSWCALVICAKINITPLKAQGQIH